MQRRQLKHDETLQGYLQKEKDQFFTKLISLIRKDPDGYDMEKYLDRVIMRSEVSTDTNYAIKHDTDLSQYSPDANKVLVGTEVEVNGVNMGRKSSRVESTFNALKAITDIRKQRVITPRGNGYRLYFKYGTEYPILYCDLLGIELHFPAVKTDTHFVYPTVSIQLNSVTKGRAVDTAESQIAGDITVHNHDTNVSQTISTSSMKFLW